MPFIDAEKRASPDMEIPGDRTFIEYKHIVEEWAKSPRWTTVDALAERLCSDPHERAFLLAFLVFFAKTVMPYENKKAQENGEI